MKRYDSELRNEIVSVPNMARFLLAGMEEQCQNVMEPEKLKQYKNIVMTGCGDSLCAAYAVKECFEELTGLHIDTPTCIEFSRHYDMKRLGDEGDTLVLLISFSGKVSRVVESAERAKKYGAHTVAVTHYPDSPVADACDYVLNVIPDEYQLGRIPGCRTYIASTQSLYMFGIHLAKSIGAINEGEAKDYLKDIGEYIELWDKRMDSLEDEIYELALTMRKTPYFEALSSGPEFATAWFAQAKIYEATNDFARYENFEDWAHVDYILRKMDAGMFLYVAKDSPAMSRAIEVASVLKRQDYEYAIFSDADASVFPDAGKVISIPTAKHYWLTPLLQGIAPCMFAGSLADIKKTTEFCKDMIETYFPFGGSILRNSKIELH